MRAPRPVLDDIAAASDALTRLHHTADTDLARLDPVDLVDGLREIERAARRLRLRVEAIADHRPPRECAWCGDPIAGRADMLYCSVRCRVARHRVPPMAVLPD